MPDGGNINPEELLQEIKNLPAELETKLTKVSDSVAKDVTDLRAELESKADENSDGIKKLEDQIGGKFEQISEMKGQLTDLSKRVDDADAALSQQGSQSKDGEVKGQYSQELARHLRKAAYDEELDVKTLQGMAEEVLRVETKNLLPEDLSFQAKSLVTGDNPNGGYFITPDMRGTIMGRIFETSPIRRLANVISTTSTTVEWVLDDDEFASGWVGEVDARPDTGNAKFGKIIIPVHEQYAKPKASQKMIDNAGFDLEGMISRKVSNKFSRMENTGFVNGDGAQRPKGFLTYADRAVADTYERNTIQQIETAGVGVIAGDDIKDLVGALIEDYQGPAVFGMKRATWTNITKLKDTQNRYLFDMISNLRDGDILRLLGKDVVLMNDMPAIATDALSVVYGDFSEGYTVVDRIGIRILRDPYSSKPFVEFYTTKGTGGAVTNYEALKLLKIQ